MSLTSYRAAPPRVGVVVWWRSTVGGDGVVGDGSWTWRRPTLPRLETQYHGRFGVSRPSSEWDRVGHPRYRPPGRGTTPVRTPSGPRLAGTPQRRRHSCWGCAAARGKQDGHGRQGWHGVLVDAVVAGWGSRSIERLGPVSCVRRRTSTPGLSTWWSTTALMARPGFAVGFPLRCVQRLSCPNLATRLRGWRHDRSTRGSSTPVLSY